MTRAKRLKSKSLNLRELFPEARFPAAEDIVVSRCVSDAFACKPGDLVVVGIDDVPADESAARALAGGASGVITEQLLPVPLPQCIVSDSREAFARLTSELANNPSEHMLTIGVAGQNGKTTTALLVSAVLRKAGIRTAYHCDIGSSDGIVQQVPDKRVTLANEMTDWFAEALDSECHAAVVEIQDSALKTRQLDGTFFDIIILCSDNTTSKSSSASQFSHAVSRLKSDGVLIANDECSDSIDAGDVLGVSTLTYGVSANANVSGRTLAYYPGETNHLVTVGDTSTVVSTKLTGDWMLRHQLAAIATGVLLEIPINESAEAISELARIPGRMQRVPSFEGPRVILDNATEPKRLFATVNSIRKERAGKVWCIGSCDPEDHHGAAEFGYAIERAADFVVLTSQHNETDNYLPAVHNILDGFKDIKDTQLIANRVTAIHWTIKKANPEDTIIVLGGWPKESPSRQRAAISTDTQIVEEALNDRHQDEEPGPVLLPHPTLLKMN